MNGLYVLKDANGAYIYKDERAGGYPAATTDFRSATTWKTAEEADGYRQTGKHSDWTIEIIVAIQTKPVIERTQTTIVFDNPVTA